MIRLTNMLGKLCYIEPDKIAAVGSSSQDVTQVFMMGDGEPFMVKESAVAVIALKRWASRHFANIDYASGGSFGAPSAKPGPVCAFFVNASGQIEAELFDEPLREDPIVPGKAASFWRGH